MSYSLTVSDDIGNQHPRRNLILLDKAVQAARKKDQALPSEAEGLTAEAVSAYSEKMKAARAGEKEFQQARKARQKDFLAGIKDPDKRIRRWLLEAMEARARSDFYLPLIDLDYSYELRYRENLEKADQLPRIAAERRQVKDELEAAKKALKEARSLDSRPQTQDFKAARKTRLADFGNDKKEWKKAYREGMISSRAFANEKREGKLAVRDEIRSLKRKLPVNDQRERVRHARHRLRQDARTRLRVLHSDLSDLRRKTPIEVKKQKAFISWLTWPLPGLGQLLLGQYAKAILFFMGSLFFYLGALPYALGRGNYRGKGIFGLISLARDGSRLDRSVIFMVEGVIAVILLLLGLLIFYQSFRDINRVEKKMIRGVRKHNWFETRMAIRRDGFPFFASAPAALVTIFIVLLPIAVTILISFTNYDPSHQSKFDWSGLANFKQIILGQGIAGGPFWLITGWTVIWTIFATSLAILIGFVLALLVNQDRIRGKKLFRTVYLLPWAVPAFITIMFFSIMFSPDGPLTSLLSSLTGQITNIKYSTWGTRIVLILLQGWLGSSYIFLLCTGILQGIPHDLYEAAKIDGATGFQATRHITIPILLFQTAPLMVGQYTFNFNNFSIIYLFNGGGPFEPSKYGNIAGSSDLLISYIYKLTIQKQYQGIGSAITLVVSLVLMFFAWVGFSRSKAFREEKL